MDQFPPLAVIIPAAGVGSRMQANKAKQYLTIENKTILEHTVDCFIQLPFVTQLYLVVSDTDETFNELGLASHPKITKVSGGKERADSVLNGLKQATLSHTTWCMVHDAARPCLSTTDIELLYQQCISSQQPGILATPVRDTMKRNTPQTSLISETVDRNNMWHALTPQCAPITMLSDAIEQQLDNAGLVNSTITDEASALELAGEKVQLVKGSVKNIKITLPEDLELAAFYLQGLTS